MALKEILNSAFVQGTSYSRYSSTNNTATELTLEWLRTSLLQLSCLPTGFFLTSITARIQMNGVEYFSCVCYFHGTEIALAWFSRTQQRYCTLRRFFFLQVFFFKTLLLTYMCVCFPLRCRREERVIFLLIWSHYALLACV